MGIPAKITAGKSTTKGAPTVKAGPSQTAKIVNPKSKGTIGRSGG